MPRREVRNPHHLPTKLCPACGRPFTWRKKWARDWEAVRFCSDKCRNAGSTAEVSQSNPSRSANTD